MKGALARRLEEARRYTKRLTADLGDGAARAQFDPGISPIAWHLGHVAWQEECWALRRAGGAEPIDPVLDSIYDSFRSEKSSRGARLPPLHAIRTYAAEVRRRTLELLERIELREEDPLLRDGWVFRFLAGHELQHAETIGVARLLGRLELELPAEPEGEGAANDGEFVEIPAGSFVLGCDDDPAGWDNERSAHVAEHRAYRLARHPVTNGAWLSFLEGGGYRDDRLWSEAGRRWRDENRIRSPLLWRHGRNGTERFTLRGWRPLDPQHPVAHVSFFEAEAFARFAGSRLPSETEWERAAGWDPATGHKRRWPWGDEAGASAVANVALTRGDTARCGLFPAGRAPCGAEELAGGVWEWTASPFAPFPGFTPGLYRGYSEPWFGDGHRVLRGGCWLSHPEMARVTFRNWFEPGVRTFPSGLRLARDA